MTTKELSESVEGKKIIGIEIDANDHIHRIRLEDGTDLQAEWKNYHSYIDVIVRGRNVKS